MSSGRRPSAQSEQFLRVLAQFEAERGVPEQVEAEVGDQVDDVGLFGVEERHGVAAAGAALQPQH